MWPFRNKYDAFISHAVEDKLPVANDLCERLERAGLKIWYSGKELVVGDSLEKAIHKGLDESRFGVVILSPTYLEKNWTRREFYTLLGKEINSRKVILPVLYNITPIDLALHDLTMADRYGLSMDKGIDVVTERLVNVIKSQQSTYIKRTLRTLGLITLLLLSIAYVLLNRTSSNDSRTAIARKLIEKRIETVQRDFDEQFHLDARKVQLMPANTDTIINLFNSFQNYRSHYRNEYEFTNGLDNLRFKKNVEPALDIELDAFSPSNNYHFQSPRIYVSTTTSSVPMVIHYVYENTEPVSYTITNETKVSDGEYLVSASFHHNIRYWRVSLLYPPTPGKPKKQQVQIQGLLPVEEFRIRKVGPDWTLATTRF